MEHFKESKLMNGEVREILKACVELLCTANELSNLEDDDPVGVDYEDVLTDIKWSKMTLENRLKVLRKC